MQEQIPIVKYKMKEVDLANQMKEEVQYNTLTQKEVIFSNKINNSITCNQLIYLK